MLPGQQRFVITAHRDKSMADFASADGHPSAKRQKSETGQHLYAALTFLGGASSPALRFHAVSACWAGAWQAEEKETFDHLDASHLERFSQHQAGRQGIAVLGFQARVGATKLSEANLSNAKLCCISPVGNLGG